jgi:hypothetical protein
MKGAIMASVKGQGKKDYIVIREGVVSRLLTIGQATWLVLDFAKRGIVADFHHYGRWMTYDLDTKTYKPYKGQ